MSDKRLIDIAYDNRPERLDEPHPAADLSLPYTPRPREQASDRAERNRLLEYCVLASIVLHLLAFATVRHMAALQQGDSTISQKDVVTPVTLVEPPPEPKKDEPPPEDASAISDRNHTAEKERVPKVIPTPNTGPVCKNETPQQQTASVAPPSASEDVRKRRHPKKPQNRRPKDRPQKNAKPGPQPPIVVSKKEDVKEWNVDVRPNIQDMKDAFAPRGSQGSSRFFPDGEEEEVVVDLNSREDRFSSYLEQVSQKINLTWYYPSSAGRAGIGGIAMLEFVVAKDGRITKLALLKSSGHTILDQTALKAIKDAAPFPRFPSGVRAKRLCIRTTFWYDNGGGLRKFLR